MKSIVLAFVWWSELAQYPTDYRLANAKIGVYSDNKVVRAELWRHKRLDCYKAVVRFPYQEFFVEVDGSIHSNEYHSWGCYYPNFYKK